jgi:hypothetical protein
VIVSASVIREASADDRNCPSVSDQVVNVTPGQPVSFRVDVRNPEGSGISIFQYPLGGILEQAGPTGQQSSSFALLDFTFIPGAEFRGSTTFTYRLTPPVGCGRGVLLGKVTLVGGPADSTASGLTVDPNTGLSQDPTKDQIDPLSLLAILALARSAGAFGAPLCGLGLVPFFAFIGLALVGLRIARRR